MHITAILVSFSDKQSMYQKEARTNIKHLAIEAEMD
jgi:hypothetical protein